MWIFFMVCNFEIDAYEWVEKRVILQNNAYLYRINENGIILWILRYALFLIFITCE